MNHAEQRAHSRQVMLEQLLKWFKTPAVRRQAEWLIDEVMKSYDNIMEASAGVVRTDGITDPEVIRRIQADFEAHSEDMARMALSSLGLVMVQTLYAVCGDPSKL